MPAAIAAAGQQDIYFSPGICAEPKNHKLATDDIIGIPGLWVDIDIYHPTTHAKQNLPKSVQEARALLPDFLPPTFIVFSGYGLHVYWLFRECWYFDTPEEKNHAQELLTRIKIYISQQATAAGWHLDSVQDLPRVMRLPGTMNIKIPEQPVWAQVIEYSENNRYNPSEIDEILPVLEQTAATTSKTRTAAFERRPTDGPAEYMLRNCMFLQHCQLNAKTISYGEWLAALTNIVRAVDGIAAAHQVSALDPDRYNQADCDKKIDECLGQMNPQSCEYIRTTLGFQGCPPCGCDMQAPCGWSLGRVAQARAKIRNITVPTPETVYQPEILGALAILEKESPAEYDIFYQRLTGQVNKNTFRKELAKHKREAKAEQAGFTVLEGGGQDVPPTDQNGDRWLASLVPDVPLNLKLPGSGSNYSMWEFGPGGIKLKKETSDGGIQYQQAAYTPIIISERISNIDTGLEKARVSFKTDFGYWRHIIVPKSTIYNTKNIVNISNSGPIVTSETARNLVKWLSMLEAANRHIIPIRQGVAKMGWRNNDTEFILPGVATNYAIDIGDDAAESTISGLGQAGDFAQWIGVMQQLRTRNKARFIMAASFAAPLLKIVGQRSFLIHNWDTTRGGKTATLHAALSVWGNPEEIAKTFADSKTNMERVAALFTDLPLGVNEDGLLTERQKNDMDSMIYMIAEGKGRGRGTKDGIQKTVSWRTIALMTGEAQITRANSRGGIFTRLIEIKGGPLVDDDIFASNLYPFTARNYGFAGKFYIEQLLRTDHNWLRDTYNKTRLALRAKYANKLESHLDAMACIALADYLASQRIFGIQEAAAGAEAIAMVEKIIDEIITKAEASESERAWEWLPDWLAANENRFQGFDQSKYIGEVFGYRESGKIFIIKNILVKALKDEGFNSNKVLSAWADEKKFPCDVLNGKRTFGIRSSREINNSRPYVICIYPETVKS
ncbi:DUF927 domain-containing protein [Sporomusa carbonis]|uniref:DUF927 domain-containing protein n=1 Tax=Sporomusa carbonis TaxID=3076075 RepID=UPI003C7AC437